MKKLYTFFPPLLWFALAVLCAGCLPKDQDTLKVMSFNIRIELDFDKGDRNWEARKTPCVRAIMKESPDIIGLQEAAPAQKLFMESNLTGYCAAGPVPEDGNPNPIFFKEETFSLLEDGILYLNENNAPGEKGWDASYVRNITWAKLQVKASGKVLYFFNTHFDDQGSLSREKSAGLAVQYICEIAPDTVPKIFCGDFNMPHSDPAFGPLNGYFEDTGSFPDADRTATFNAFGESGMTPLTIDHIFCRNVLVKEFQVITEEDFGVQYISDHYPISATLKF